MEGYRGSRSGTRGQAQNPSKPSNFTQKAPSASSSSVSSSNKEVSPKTTSSKPLPSRGQGQTASTSSLNSSKSGTGETSKDKSRSKRPAPAKKEDDKTVKNPDLIQPEKSVDNDDLINGLALQRQWDEKPDIDHLATSLLNLYQKSESQGSNLSELRAKIFLSSLRVRSKSLSFLNFTHSKLRCMIRFCRHLNLKYNSLNDNLPRIEKHYLKLCRFYQNRRSLNEVYERLSRMVSKLPNSNQVQLISRDLSDKKLKTLEKIDRIKEQIEFQKTQIQNISQLMSGITSPLTPPDPQ